MQIFKVRLTCAAFLSRRFEVEWILFSVPLKELSIVHLKDVRKIPFRMFYLAGIFQFRRFNGLWGEFLEYLGRWEGRCLSSCCGCVYVRTPIPRIYRWCFPGRSKLKRWKLLSQDWTAAVMRPWATVLPPRRRARWTARSPGAGAASAGPRTGWKWEEWKTALTNLQKKQVLVIPGSMQHCFSLWFFFEILDDIWRTCCHSATNYKLVNTAHVLREIHFLHCRNRGKILCSAVPFEWLVY